MLESIRTINDVKEQNMENRHTIKRKWNDITKEKVQFIPLDYHKSLIFNH